jgi:hypothetical protein
VLLSNSVNRCYYVASLVDGCTGMKCRFNDADGDTTIPTWNWPGMEPDLRNKRCATEVMVTVMAERDRVVLSYVPRPKKQLTFKHLIQHNTT